MLEHNRTSILTLKGGTYAIQPYLYDYLCLTAERKLYYNLEYANHPQVLNKIALFKQINVFDDMPVPVSLSELRELYNNVAPTNQESSHLQREISDLFKLATNQNVSDIHIIVRKNECIIKVRRVGDLYIEHQYTAAHGHALCKTIFMTMCDQAGKTFQPKSRQDARIKSIFLPHGITGVRIGTSPTDVGYIMVCRLLKQSAHGNLNLYNLGYQTFQIEQINQAKSKKGGINIFAGPTGAGKSTTLAIIISLIIHESNGTKHIITAENPVEYEIGSTITLIKNMQGQKVTQNVINYATQTPIMASTTKRKQEIFSEAIVAMMRLDPDVIMIGEIRDSGSLSAAIDASMTGHQVWTSVHATTAIGIIKRLITVSKTNETNNIKELICDATIISSLTAQRLVKRMCSKCSFALAQNNCDEKLLHRMQAVFGQNLQGIKLRNKHGCASCYKGYIGRTVIAEIINTDQQFMDLMLQSNFAAYTYWLETLKGIPMMIHGLIQIKQGFIDPYDLEDELEFIKLPLLFSVDYFRQLILE